MFWLGGFLALEVTTSTPDALCPPLEEARAAIRARVGDVRGSYHAEFAVVRADDGHAVLDLVVREGDQQLLRRELPLDEAGCQDAAQALALVLERFFDAVDLPAKAESAAEPEPVPASAGTTSKPQYHSASRAAPGNRVNERATDNTRGLWRMHLGLAQDRELGLAPVLGVALFPPALALAAGLRWGLGLELAPFLTASSETVRGEEISALSLQLAAYVPLAFQWGMWSSSFGPWAQLRGQRAEAAALANDRSAYRVLPGVGGFARLGWAPAARWTLGAGVALGGQIVSASPRFTLRQREAGTIAVLVPEPWFAQGHVAVTLAL